MCSNKPLPAGIGTPAPLLDIREMSHLNIHICQTGMKKDLIGLAKEVVMVNRRREMKPNRATQLSYLEGGADECLYASYPHQAYSALST